MVNKKTSIVILVFLPLLAFSNPVPIIKSFEFNWEKEYLSILFLFFLFLPAVLCEYAVASLIIIRKLTWDYKLFWMVLLMNSISYPITLYASKLFIIDWNISVYYVEIIPVLLEYMAWLLILKKLQLNYSVLENKIFNYAAALTILSNLVSFFLSYAITIVDSLNT